MPPTIDKALCIGCGECARNCPVNAIMMVDEKAKVTDPQACIHCGMCDINCPKEAIKLKRIGPTY